MNIKNKTNAQVTLFILIALVIVIVIGVAAYMFQQASTKTAKTESEKSQDISLEVQTVKNYVTACLDKTLNDGMTLLGAQGGRIYEDQGGPATTPALPLTQGTTYLSASAGNAQATRVWYGVTRLNLSNALACATSGAICNQSATPTLNSYPWVGYTTGSNTQCDSTISTIGCLGRSNRLSNEGQLDFTAQLESYIAGAIAPCSDFSEFEKQGYEFDAEGTPLVTVTLSDAQVTAKLYYELGVVDPTTQKQTFLTEFYAERPTRIKELFTLAKQIALDDITDAGYDVSSASNPSNDILVSVLRSSAATAFIPAEDSIVQIKDTENEFIFQFARQNRAPVLDKINPITVAAPMTKAVLDGMIGPQAHDPDETTPVIVYLEAIDQQTATTFAASCPFTTKTIVCVSDRTSAPCHPTTDTAKDWQEVSITCLSP